MDIKIEVGKNILEIWNIGISLWWGLVLAVIFEGPRIIKNIKITEKD